MNEQPAFFETLRQKARERWDQLESDPDLAGPWHQLFKQVQSPRHVLSELLQNADDAGATEASVDITDGCFVFAHNGEDFTEEHFASLCRFGYSNKRALHTIGFRGIGFKSTFSLGDTVELDTPSLSIAFDRRRFTEPRWIERRQSASERTLIRVPIRDEHRQREIEKNLKEWLASPVSLLFFKHIRRMRIGSRDVHWRSLGPGPVTATERMALHDNPGEVFLVARSEAEAFPEEALAEIRQERLLGDGLEAGFPPCKVEIVLGAKGRLYVVLPTGVKTALPFACNAPFIQDPARLKIKDPETSPTNRWLLERAGSLAADAMFSWLQQGSMDIAERAGAYAFLPDVDLDDNSLEGVCATTVEESFRAQLDGAEYVLTDAGNLTTAGQSVVIPDQLCDVWPADTIAGFLDAAVRPAFAKTVFDGDRKKLLRWGAIEAISSDQFFAVLQSVHLPRPKTWRRLLSLWAYVAPDITKYSPKVDAKKVRIFPVQGKDEMYSAEEIVRLGERRLLQSDEDWEFLANHLLVLNQNWIRFLAEERRGADEKQDVGLQQEIHAAHSVLKTAGIDDASDVSKVIEKVAAVFFAQQSVPIADCVRIAQIASTLGATLGPSFQFVTRDNRRRGISAVIIFDPSGSLEDLLPEIWRQQHFLHPDYSASFTSCTSEEWLQWTTTGRSRISLFAPLTKKKTPLRGRVNAIEEVVRRGFSGTPWRPFVTSQYVIDDWDFDDDLWRHWTQLSLSDERVWHQIMELVLAQPISFWKSASSASVLQVATTGNTRSITFLPLLPDWVLKFRDLPCLPDTRGSCRKPADLLRRAPETESLIGVELFIHGKLDTESNRPLLTLLGVRNTPTGPDRLLNCLRALAKSETPPTHEVEKWYLRLDQLTDACSTEDLANITQALLEERIVLTENCGWAAGAGVFLSSDDDDVPGAAVIRRGVSDLSLWRKIGMAERPTADRAIAWLKTLPWNESLPPEDLRRVKALLARHAFRIWNECSGWINLAGEWVPVASLSFSLTMRSLIPWSQLHLGIKKKTADFQRLSVEIQDLPPFSEPPTLASKLEERFTQQQGGFARSERKAWIAQLGVDIGRMRLDADGVEESRIRHLATQLAETVWQYAPSLEIVPYIDGTPAGTARDADVVWRDKILHVKNLPNARLARLVPEKIGRAFSRPDIVAALSYCFGRSPSEVTEYMEQNFDLSAPASGDAEPEPELASANNVETDDASPRRRTESLEPPLADQADETAAVEDTSIGDPTPAVNPKPSPDDAAAILEGHDVPRPRQRPSPRPTTSGVVERFAQSHGFQKVSDDLYSHPDGSRISRAHGESFSWIRGNDSGEIACHYWAKDHCLEHEPLQINAEVWGMFEKFPKNHALLLSSPTGNVVEIRGEKLKALCKEGNLILYPATYRLVYQDGK